MRFFARYRGGREMSQTYFSIGGGAILAEGQDIDRTNVTVRYPFSSAAELLATGRETGFPSRPSSGPMKNPDAGGHQENAGAFQCRARHEDLIIFHHGGQYAASAIGFLYKARASISAAGMGCQGEVGVACSMAAAGLVAALGGSNEQVENAAEIGMEHNLGLTCDPVGGLVQVPCIERNTMDAVKAINAAYLALHGDGQHIVSLDAVIETMRQTGNDMRSKYKETSLGGLAVNVVEC